MPSTETRGLKHARGAAEPDRREGLDPLEGVRPPGWGRVGPEHLAWSFVAFGIGLRLLRYLRCFPLWGDEAMVAVNFLDRDYLELLKPLDYMQICPILFLWIERAAVDAFGFHEWSLRLWPTLASVASVPLFAHLAGRLAKGWTVPIAVGVFAMAILPVRHGAEVKPYSTDLLCALALITLGVEAWRSERPARWMLGLAALVPWAVAGSHPSVFVAGAVSLGLLGRTWTDGSARTWMAYSAYNLILILAFVAVYMAHTRHQSQQALETYREGCWAASFPPLEDPAGFVSWFALMNTGHLFSYPVGDKNGASILTTIAFVTGIVWLGRRGRLGPALMLVIPFGLTFLAALMGRYPYGGTARVFQYLAPGICLGGGLGFAWWIGRIRSPGRRSRFASLLISGLGALGVGLLIGDLACPYRTAEERHSRGFARWFWTNESRDAELVSLRDDFGLALEPLYAKVPRLELFRCNRAIQDPEYGRSLEARLDEVSARKPLRCVLFNEDLEGHPRFARWRAAMERGFILRDQRAYTVNEGVFDGVIPCEERYLVFEFVPKREAAVAEAVASAIAVGEGSKRWR